MDITSVAVFCGSRPGTDPRHLEVASALGRTLAESGVRVVYGGGTIGLMGAVADAALAAGGQVVGVMPQSLADREVLHTGLTEFHVVPDMHTRKAMMAGLADAFVTLPGGIGTLEEVSEQWTWNQIDIQDKPIAFLDTTGYYAPLREMVGRMVAEGFLAQDVADSAVFLDTVDAVLPQLRGRVATV